MQNPIGAIVSHPIFLLFASVAVFLIIIWAVLPFALFGVRKRLDLNLHRLDRIAATLGEIVDILDRSEWRRAGQDRESSRGEEDSDGQGSPGKLFADLRKELQQFGPFMRERLIEPGEFEYVIRDEEGEEIRALFLSFQQGGVRVSIPIVSLERVFSGFSSERFREYANSFLSEKHGYFMEPSSSGLELHVNIEPQVSNALDLFVGIIREQMVDPIEGGGA
ncbi:hypothetical protein ACFLQ0_01305 [Nitrospinota bacterium]